MKYYVYAIRDNVSDSFSLPVYARSDDEIKRNIAYNLQRNNSMMSQYASDYDIYLLGIFDDDDGSIKPIEHVLVAHLSQLLRMKGVEDDVRVETE